MCVVCSFCAVPNTANEIIAIDVKYIGWDIMTITNISPQDFESWNGYQLHITNEKIVQHLVSQIATLHRDSTNSFDVRGTINIVLPNDTIVYYYSKFYLYDGEQYYTMSPQLEQGSIRVARKYYESIHIYRLSIGYLSVMYRLSYTQVSIQIREKRQDGSQKTV